MKKLVLSIATISCASIIAFAVPTAQEKFSVADTNGDQIITSEEFYNDQARKMEIKSSEGKALRGAATAPQFDNVDANNDGKVTNDEFSKFHTVRQAQMKTIKSQARNKKQLRDGSGQGKQKGKNKNQ